MKINNSYKENKRFGYALTLTFCFFIIAIVFSLLIERISIPRYLIWPIYILSSFRIIFLFVFIASCAVISLSAIIEINRFLKDRRVFIYESVVIFSTLAIMLTDIGSYVNYLITIFSI